VINIYDIKSQINTLKKRINPKDYSTTMRDFNELQTSVASFNLDAGYPLMPNQDFFIYGSEKEYNGKIPFENVILIHQQTFWIQYISSGISNLINNVKKFRDGLIFKHFAQNPSHKGKYLDSITKGTGLPFYAKETLSEVQNKLKKGEEPYISMASMFYWVENMWMNPALASQRAKNAISIATAIAFSKWRFDFLSSENQSFVNHYMENSLFSNSVTEDGMTFSTIQLMEAQALLNEFFLEVITEDLDLLNRRIIELQNKPSFAPISYAFGCYYEFLDFKISLGKSGSMTFLSVLITTQIAIDIALDVFCPLDKNNVPLAEQDVYPPHRYYRALLGTKEISIMEVKFGLTLEDVADYRNLLSSVAGLRTNNLWYKKNPLIRDTYTRLLGKFFYEDNLGKNGSVSLDYFHNHYDLINFLHNEAQIMRNENVYFSTDIMVSLLNLNQGKIDVRFDRYVQSESKKLYIPPAFIYKSGEIGCSDSFPNFGKFYVDRSMITYPFFGTVFECTSFKAIPFQSNEEHNNVNQVKENFKTYFESRLKTTTL